MRFFKVFSIIFIVLLLVLTIALTITYSARVAVINHFTRTQLSSIQASMTCLDISLASDMNIIVDKLCLQTPKADIELTNMAVRWQYSPQMNLTDIDVSSANIKGTAPLFANTNLAPSSNNPNNSNQSIKQLLLTTLRPYTEEISQYQLPVNINVAEISYLPFKAINQTKSLDLTLDKTAQQQTKTTYTATLSAANKSISFSLRSAEKVEFFKVKLNKKTSENKEDFSIELSSKLALLKDFIAIHQLPIAPEIQDELNANKISGNLNSIIEYQAGYLSMQNKLTEIAITSEKGIGINGAFNILGTLNFNSQLNLLAQSNKKKKTEKIAVNFTDKNKIYFDYNSTQLIKVLEENGLSAEIISILKDNPLDDLTLKLQDNTILTFNQNNSTTSTLKISNIEMSAQSDERSHRVKIKKITFALPNSKNSINPKVPAAFSIDNFIIDSQLNLARFADLAKFTTKPVTIHLDGSIKKTETKTELNLTENSLITAKNISVLNNKELLSLKSLATKLNGNVQLAEDKSFILNLTVQNQASQVNIPDTLKIKSFDLISQINGKLDDIKVHTAAKADGVALGDMVITGSALAPKIRIAGNKLQLTDLLALKMKLPTKVELIDGLLDYSVSGKVANLNAIEKTPFNVSVKATSVSGDVDGIWLQELNWQQNFTLLKGKITTLPNTADNLTIKLIDTPTPISNLSINTNWTFDKTLKLNATNLKGNFLGGSFDIPAVEWPFQQSHSVKVQLNSIDLSQVVALDKNTGIVVTGQISGEIPITFNGEKYSIENGELHNVSKGLIQVINNPAVENLKSSNTGLQLAFGALENLHYNQLSSAVSIADDGYMLLETVIKGHNPDIENDVNLNLNLSYDLVGLLKSLSITQRFENSIVERLQKH